MKNSKEHIFKKCSSHTNQENPIYIERRKIKPFASLEKIRKDLNLNMISIVKDLGFSNPSIILNMEIEERQSNM